MRERSFALRKGGLGSQAKPEANPRDMFDLDAETRLYRPDVPVTPSPALLLASVMPGGAQGHSFSPLSEKVPLHMLLTPTPKTVLTVLPSI